MERLVISLHPAIKNIMYTCQMGNPLQQMKSRTVKDHGSFLLITRLLEHVNLTSKENVRSAADVDVLQILKNCNYLEVKKHLQNNWKLRKKEHLSGTCRNLRRFKKMSANESNPPSNWNCIERKSNWKKNESIFEFDPINLSLAFTCENCLLLAWCFIRFMQNWAAAAGKLPGCCFEKHVTSNGFCGAKREDLVHIHKNTKIKKQIRQPNGQSMLLLGIGLLRRQVQDKHNPSDYQYLL